MSSPKYIGDSKMFEYDKYYHMCKEQMKPFIKAKKSPIHGNYFVQIDLMTCGYTMSKLEQSLVQELIEAEIQYVESESRYAFRGFNIDKELAWFDGVSVKHVDSFCNSLYDIAQKHHGN